MLKSENLLASLSNDITALEQNAEGQLRGGFAMFDANDIIDTYNGNCFVENCNCTFHNETDCATNCNCTHNKGCPGKTTSSSGKARGGVGITMLF